MVANTSLAAFAGGIGLNLDPGYPQSLPMFAAAGFRHVRVSLFWSLMSYTTGTISTASNQSVVNFLVAAQSAGLRPLVLLQAFDQGPCPYTQTLVKTANAIAATDTTITLTTSPTLTVGLSGLTGFVTSATQANIAYTTSNNVMCATLVTAVSGRQITLSKPVGTNIPAGATLVINTLLHKPWSAKGSSDYNNTMNGWLAYLGAASTFMQSVLGTAGASDLGFDIEIWNETSFGSDFLDINNYYSSQQVAEQYVNGIPAVIPDIVAQSSAYIEANPTQFAGVRVSDGFASVSPIQASSSEPVAVSALSKHPYPSPLSYPSDDDGYDGLDVDGNVTSFIPTYDIYTHEYFSTAINPFTLARDISTTTNSFGGVDHGQNARTINGAVAPVSVWMTEIGTATGNIGVTDPNAIALLTAKGTLRALFFNLGIGVERVYVFTGIGDTTSLALVPTSAPTTPTLVLTALKDALAFIAGNDAGASAGTLAYLGYSLAFAGGSTPALLFDGNGGTTPDFVQPSDHVLIPVQVTPTRTAFIHWFSALDMRNTMSSVPVVLTLVGLPGGTPVLTAFDPIGNASVPAVLSAQGDGALTINTMASDSPFILVVDQTG